MLENLGSKLYLVTNLNAPNKKIVTVDASNPTPNNWVDFINETEHVLSPSSGSGYFFAEYMTVAGAPLWINDLKKHCNIPSENLTILTKHVELDVHHVDEQVKFLNHFLGQAKDINKDEIEIRYNGSLLRYKNLPVLKAPSYKDLDDEVINPKKRTWLKKFDFK